MPISVANALATGVSRLARSAKPARSDAAPRRLMSVAAAVGVADRARRRGQRLHAEKHRLHVGMRDDQAHRPTGGTGRAALAATVRISERVGEGAVGDADALDADAEAGDVHHREHAGEAAILLADQPADRSLALAAIDHGAGGRAVQAELLLDAGTDDVVAVAERAVVVDAPLRHQKKRDAARAFGCIGEAGEDEVDDVVGEIMLAEGDEVLLAEQPIGAVAGPLGARRGRRRGRSRPAARSGSSSPSTRPRRARGK